MPTQLGAFGGSLLAFALGDKLGRKISIAIGLALNTIGAILQASALHFAQLMSGRIVNGLGAGRSLRGCPLHSPGLWHLTCYL